MFRSVASALAFVLALLAADTALASNDPVAEKVDAFVAGLTDAEARKALLHELKSRAAEAQARPGAGGEERERGGARTIVMLRHTAQAIGDRLAALREALANWQEPVGSAFRNLTDFEGWPAIGHALLALAGMIAIGSVAEWLAHRRIDPQEDPSRPRGEDARGIGHRLAHHGGLYVRRVLAAAAFQVAGFAASFLFFDRFDPLREANVAVLLAIFVVRVVGATILTAQEFAGAEPVFGAGWRRALQVPAAIASVGYFGGGLLSLVGLAGDLLLAFELTFGTLFVLSGIAWLLFYRRWLSRTLVIREGEFSATPYIGSVILVVMGAAWSATMLMGRGDRAAAAATGIALVVVVPVFLLVVRSIVLALFKSEPETRPDEAKRRNAVAHGIFFGARFLTIVAAAIVFAEAWDIGAFEIMATPVGRTVVGGIFKVGIAWLLGLLLWEAIRQAIDKRLSHEDRGDGSASRAATLLPLFRSFLLVVVIVMIGLVTMSALGIDIGPLLAGAGIVGLAIGFGAQTLVRDIVAGIFFLIDDAFRVGDYVELGRLRGTVERITLRSLQLRHHRGPVHTIPFGRVEAVTNYTRDWVIEKLELRLQLGTDIDKVKKIIKKIGQDLAADPELGPNFIEPLKSQGVTALQDNSLMVKVKFMAKPREQFVIRREAYRRILKEFDAAGIRFFQTSLVVQGADGVAPPVG